VAEFDACVCGGELLVTLYHYAVPRRPRWRDHLLGAGIATGIWLAGAAAVRAYLRYAFDNLNLYGPVSTPIAAQAGRMIALAPDLVRRSDWSSPGPWSSCAESMACRAGRGFELKWDGFFTERVKAASSSDP
jgi:hypothetical protein